MGAGKMGLVQSLFTSPPRLTDALWTREIPAHALKGYLMDTEANGSLSTKFTWALHQTKLSDDSVTDVSKTSVPILIQMDSPSLVHP